MRTNSAANLYAAIGGTAGQQAVAIQLGWTPDAKPNRKALAKRRARNRAAAASRRRNRGL
ncbi:MAG: hypothetical protein ACRYGG_21385 [Janthinobacterium lividum]